MGTEDLDPAVNLKRDNYDLNWSSSSRMITGKRFVRWQQTNRDEAAAGLGPSLTTTGLVTMLWSVRFHLIELFSSFQSLADNSSRKQNDLKLVTNVSVYKVRCSELENQSVRNFNAVYIVVKRKYN